jgi:hypothetical protein
MTKKTGVILCGLVLAAFLWASSGYSGDEDRVGPNAWLMAHVGQEMLITLEASLYDELGKVLVIKLLDVEEDGVVAMLIGNTRNREVYKHALGDPIKLWIESKLSLFLTYSSIVSIQTFKEAKGEIWRFLRMRQKENEKKESSGK